MSVNPIQLLETYGPQTCRQLEPAAARRWCRRLTHRRYENFTVLSPLVPADRRDDFAAIYAFCRWADDLGDEVGDPARSLELLTWWRSELEQCFAGAPRHPVFVALAPTIERHELTPEPFGDLITAFEQDQRVSRYETWADVVAYCRLSANPVGRLVLAVLADVRDGPALAESDAICTALQLTNHWQDIGRDLVDRDRIYVPQELIAIDEFESRARRSVAQGYAVDQTFLGETRTLVRGLVDRTWPLYDAGRPLLDRLPRRPRAVVGLLAAGGQRVLRMIEEWNYETVLHRPSLGPVTRARLVAGAFLAARFGRGGARS
ncbi:MAG: squalene synthase HpnC [Phycisphaerae bacterium]|nr:squalene synthase HpnC [Phycisphaerae bacterium]NNF44999.1 squalene synthase HpnC [Phycisphaerales bacterium]